MFLHYLILIPSFLLITRGQNVTDNVTLTDSTFETDYTQNDTSTTEPDFEVLCREDGSQWQCKNRKQCIDNNQLCNGVIECSDASDEYLDTCRNATHPRPLVGLILHCSNSLFWTGKHNYTCPAICRKSPEFCYYAFLGENKVNGTCPLPDFPENGEYTIVPANQTDPAERVKFQLNYHCKEPYVIVQQSLLTCENGEWNEEDPENNRYCSKACPLNRNDNFTYVCPLDLYNSTECNNYVAIGTKVNVTRANQETTDGKAPVIVQLVCSENETFPISTNCVDEVDKLQQEFESPTMQQMTDYESKFNMFKTNETSSTFHNLVEEFRKFEAEVRGKLSFMHEVAEKCDISLDLLLHLLQIKKEDKVTSL